MARMTPRGLTKIARRAARHIYNASRTTRDSFPPPSLTSIVARLYDGRPAVVVQVGSNDGLQHDPIAPLIRTNPEWQVLFIEPLPHLFRRLTANYPQLSRYRFENVAISEKKEVRPLYYISDDIKKTRNDVPWWYDQLGSFDPSHIVRHGQEFEPFITSEPVRCEPLREVLTRNRIETIDLLQIDTEGYDYQILKQVDLGASSPGAILYEHRHLSSADALSARSLLTRAGYRMRSDDWGDTLAIKRDSFVNYLKKVLGGL
jgi:FkbM family methyltransferase